MTTGKQNKGTQTPATAPVIISRTPIFAPSLKRTVGHAELIETPWGKVKVRGNLTQIHRGILDAINSTYIKYRDESNGAGSFLVDPYQITKVANVSRDYAWLRAKLNELRKAEVTLITNTLVIDTGIVSDVTVSKKTVPLPGGKLNGERHLWVITLSKAWMSLYKCGWVAKYGSLLLDIQQLESGAAQALVRFCLSHQNGGHWKLNDALTYIGAFRTGLTEKRKEQIINDVVTQVNGAQGKLGITITKGKEDYVVHYNTRHPSVSFSPPSFGIGEAPAIAITHIPENPEAILAVPEAIWAA